MLSALTGLGALGVGMARAVGASAPSWTIYVTDQIPSTVTPTDTAHQRFWALWVDRT